MSGRLSISPVMKNTPGFRGSSSSGEPSLGYVPNPVRGLWQERDSYKPMTQQYDQKLHRNGTSQTPSMRINLGFNDTSSLESIFGQLGLSPPGRAGTNLREPSNRSMPRSSVPRIVGVSRKSFDTLDVGKGRCHEQRLKVSPELLAQQITLVEMKFFQAIQPEELTSLKWNGKEKQKHAPNIVASTRWFNQLIFWVQKDILNEEMQSKRAEVLSHFIRIAKKLVDMNNYSSGMAIISGLQVQCVHRLSATWAALSSRDRSTFRKLVELFSQDQNYTNLRTAVDNARLPCIPYLGVYLSDLTYIDVAAAAAAQHQNSSTVWSQQVKQDRINNVLRTIANFQQSQYPFAIDEKVIAYLESQRYIEELQRFIEDANYKLSLRLEPPTSGGFSTSTESSFALSTRHTASASVLKPVPVQPSTSPIKNTSGNAVLHCNNDEKPQVVKSATSSPTSCKLTRHLVDLFVPPLLPPPPKHPHAHRQPVRAHEAPVPLHPGSNCVPRNPVMPSHRRLGSWTGTMTRTDFDQNGPTPSTHPGNSSVYHLSPRNPGFESLTPNSSCSTSTSRSLLHVEFALPVQPALCHLLEQTDGQKSLHPLLPSLGTHKSPKILSRSPPTPKLTESPTGDSLVLLHRSRTAPGSPSEAMAESSPTVSRCNQFATSSLVVNKAAMRRKTVLPEKQGVQIIDSRTKPNRSQTVPRQPLDPCSPSSSLNAVRTPDATSKQGTSARKRDQVSRCPDTQTGIPDEDFFPTYAIHQLSNSPRIQVTDNDNRSVDEHIWSNSMPLESDFCPSSTDPCFSAHTPLIRSRYAPFSPPVPSYLTMAALAAVQGSITDDLIRLSAVNGCQISSPHESHRTHHRKISPNPQPPATDFSSTKTTCWDVQLANGLRVLREGCICFKHSSISTYRKVKAKNLRECFGKTNTRDALFESCDALAIPDHSDHALNKRAHDQFMSFTGPTFSNSWNSPSSSLVTSTPSPSTSLSDSSSGSLTFDALSPPSCPSKSPVSHAHSAVYHTGYSDTNHTSVATPPNTRHHKRVHSTCLGPTWVGESSESEKTVATTTTTTISDGFLHRWRHHRVKFRWAVLVVSDNPIQGTPSSLIPHAFLVLFKLRRKHTRLAVPICGDNTSTTIQGRQSTARNCVALSSWSSYPYSPDLFSPRRCEVLRIQAAVIDPDATVVPSVLVLDSSQGPKLRPYRLTRYSALTCDKKQRRLSTATRWRCVMESTTSPSLISKTRSELIHSLRTLWPFRWSATKCRMKFAEHVGQYTPQCRSGAPVLMRSPTNRDPWDVWYPLLKLFHDQQPQDKPKSEHPPI
ncbi:hypothetical protein CRM22_003599 [Opisthorchis felineus]|uniref:Ras-GEF domain-containing protein n=1 Tax=Opisthorchis felineus TaxID=147828 RepID=A0A4S2M0F4_OPIFE|nr:hypothetical protein CRM22_003599 [Opisthorchis felineus]